MALFHLSFKLICCLNQVITYQLVMPKIIYKLFLLPIFMGLGCTVMKTEHHITLDHNISIKIEKEVNNFLDDLYEDVSLP